MATAVSIEVTLDDQGVVTGVNKVGSSLNQISGGLQKIGQQGNVVFTQMAKNQREAREAAQLLSQSIGVQIPGSLEKALAHIGPFRTALAAAFQASVVVGLIAALGEFSGHIDEVTQKIYMFGLRMDQLFSKDIRNYLQRLDLDQFLDPLIEKANQASDAALMAGKKGFEVIRQLLKNTLSDLDYLQHKLNEGINLKFGADSSSAQRYKDAVAGEIKSIAAAAQIEADAKISDLFSDFMLKVRAARKDLDKDMDDANHRQAQEFSQLAEQSLQHEKEANDRRLQLLDAQVEAETEFQRQRAEMSGDTIGAMIIDERARVDTTIDGLRKMGVEEGQLADLRVQLQRNANQRVAMEMQKAYEDMATAIVDGNVGAYISGQFKKLGVKMLASMLAGMNFPVPNGNGGTVGGFGGSVAGGISLPGIFGLPSGVGIPGGASGGLGTPPFIGNSFLPGGVGSSAAPGTPAMIGSGGRDSSSVILSNAPGVGFGGVFRNARLGALANLGALGAVLGAGKIGGGFATAGALIGIGGLAALYGPNLQATMAAAPFAQFLGPAAGGLIGFGVGSQHGTLAGSLSGAGTGALVGLLAAGPVGALIGGIVGTLGGIFGGLFGGSKRRKQAEQFYQSQLQQVNQIENQYKGFQLDFASALGQLESIRSNGYDQLHKLKGEGSKVFDRELAPAIGRAEDDIKRIEDERQRRSTLVFAPPQFATVGFFSGSSMRAAGGGSLAVLHPGEFVVNPQATARNRGALEQINRGGGAANEAFGGALIPIRMTDGKNFAECMLREGLWALIGQKARETCTPADALSRGHSERSRMRLERTTTASADALDPTAPATPVPSDSPGAVEVATVITEPEENVILFQRSRMGSIAWPPEAFSFARRRVFERMPKPFFRFL